MQKPSVVLFDMDGLIFDTGRLAYRAYLAAGRDLDFTVTPDVYYYLTGRKEEEIRLVMQEIYGPKAPVDRFRDAINHYKSLWMNEAQRVYKKEGLLALLEELKKQKIQCVLATSTKRETTDRYLVMEGMVGVFDAIFTGDLVPFSKPNPEIFLRPCRSLGIAPAQALVLEDSYVGVKAAEQGGIPVFQIPDDITDFGSHQGAYALLADLKALMAADPIAPRIFPSLTAVRDFFAQA